MVFSYGKYKGHDIRSVPATYLEWLIESSRDTIRDAEEELRRRQMEEDMDDSMAERIIKAGYRELSKRLHPDAGGNHEDMVDLNVAYKQLLGDE